MSSRFFQDLLALMGFLTLLLSRRPPAAVLIETPATIRSLEGEYEDGYVGALTSRDITLMRISLYYRAGATT